MADLTGINLAMQTPMHADGSIDYSRWEELIEFTSIAVCMAWCSARVPASTLT